MNLRLLRPILAANFILLSVWALPAHSQASDAWTNVGILDSGIDGNSPYLTRAPRIHLSKGFGCTTNTTDDLFCNGSIVGHGTMVSGVLAGDPIAPGVPSIGMCPGCSIIMGKRGIGETGEPIALADSATWVLRKGAQVVNLSAAAFYVNINNGEVQGLPEPPYPCPPTVPPASARPFCNPIAEMQSRDVILVTATGNDDAHTNYGVYWGDPRQHVVPAMGIVSASQLRDPSTYPAEYANYLHTGSPYVRWDERVLSIDSWSAEQSNGCPYFPPVSGRPTYYECGSNYPRSAALLSRTFAGFARDVQVVFPYLPTGNFTYRFDCRDYITSTDPRGVGTCRGTSFAAPQVSAAVAAARSANPLLSYSATIDVMGMGSSEYAFGLSDVGGGGLPDYARIREIVHGRWQVGSTLRKAKNRAIPLFGLVTSSSSTAYDTVHTAVPQVAVAALLGELMSDDLVVTSSPYSSLTAFPSFTKYPAFPSITSTAPTTVPRANMLVLAGNLSPYASVKNEPLYRFSAATKCLSGKRAHYYGAGEAERTSLTTTGLSPSTVCADGTGSSANVLFRVDAQEGWVLPSCPSGLDCSDTAASISPKCIYRRTDTASGNTMLLIGGQRSSAAYSAYTTTWNRDCIGYAYENVDSDGDGLPDGAEVVIGTSATAVDSDGDNYNDNIEYPFAGYSLKDPANNLSHP